jgi:hypothetical protein
LSVRIAIALNQSSTSIFYAKRPAAFSLSAQSVADYPTKPVKIFVGFAAAGAQAKFMNAAELNAYETAETRKWIEAVKYSGAKMD